jgi:ribosomal-protein-alanine N-acetyltransferase
MIRSPRLTLRPWRRTDCDALVLHANNRNVWLNLRDRFPHPYTHADAEAWIAFCAAQSVEPMPLAIEHDGAAVGGIGIELGSDVNRRSGEIGYWLGESLWGRGLATEAVVAMTTYSFARLPIERLHAAVFEWNPASARVLEKAGYELEGRLKRSIYKDGRWADSLLYARLRS